MLQWLAHLKVAHKLIVGFGFVLLLMSSTLAASAFASTQQTAVVDRLIHHLYPARYAARDIVTLSLDVDNDAARYLLSRDKGQAAASLRSYYQNVQQIREGVILAKALADTDTQRKELEAFTTFYFGKDGYYDDTVTAFKQKQAGKVQAAYDSFVHSPFAPSLQVADQYIAIVNREIAQETALSSAVAHTVLLLNLALGGLATLLGIGIATVTVRSLQLRDQQLSEQNQTLTRANARLSSLATTDPLTELGNHRAYQEHFHREVEHARRYRETLAVAWINIDELKVMNDEQGYLYGDQVLTDLATLLRNIQQTHFTFRLSGDTFVMLLPDTPLEAAVTGMEQLRQEAQRCLSGATISIGVTAIEADKINAETVQEQAQEQAEAALQAAKQRGRNRVVTFEAVRESVSLISSAQAQMLRRLLTEQKLTVAFQPIWEMHDGGILAFEALTRPAAEYGFAGPQEAFDIAMKMGRAHELDYVCVQAILARSADLPPNALLFLNITPQTLVHELLTGAVLLEAVVSAGLTVDRIVLEITERAIVQLDVVIREVKRLQGLGFRLALDDAGAGNAGLEMLSQVAVDFVKIDRAVVVNALTDKAARGVMIGIQAMAHEAGIIVVAEGIENVEMLDLVQKMGVQAVQGYLLGRPSEIIPDARDLQRFSPFVQGSDSGYEIVQA
ncbi:MAG: EAL domain-containing protein [Ktedonobacteraceae bacterium]